MFRSDEQKKFPRSAVLNVLAGFTQWFVKNEKKKKNGAMQKKSEKSPEDKTS